MSALAVTFQELWRTYVAVDYQTMEISLSIIARYGATTSATAP
jgi:hypothetical protein